MTTARKSLIEVSGLTKHFGGLTAVDGLDFELGEGEVLGLIGPNGAGKSTTFNLLTGGYPASAGSVRLDGEEMLGLPPHRIAARGIMRTFQHNMPFEGMSVADNVLVGAHTTMRAGLGKVLLGAAAARDEERKARARAIELIDFVGLREFQDAEVTTLSFGQGRLLETARALAGEPRIMLFDEPAAGLTPSECDRLGGIIRGIAGRGISILLIEHDMRFLLPLADRVVVLNFGRKIADGAPDEIRSDPAVVDAYLGEAGGVGAAAGSRAAGQRDA
ncbi:MAG TPA: ABC transporter ATP-binding protein [Alphaproteobacteria bacterium]|nr:ABC transporter ATP-binding protein [Alphaproteobacteria bacterium]